MTRTSFLTGLTAAAALAFFAVPSVAGAQDRERDKERRGVWNQQGQQGEHGQRSQRGKLGQRNRDEQDDEFDRENDDQDNDDGAEGGRVNRTGTGQCVDVNGQRY